LEVPLVHRVLVHVGDVVDAGVAEDVLQGVFCSQVGGCPADHDGEFTLGIDRALAADCGDGVARPGDGVDGLVPRLDGQGVVIQGPVVTNAEDDGGRHRGEERSLAVSGGAAGVAEGFLKRVGNVVPRAVPFDCVLRACCCF
jgi:hypothetical protein